MPSWVREFVFRQSLRGFGNPPSVLWSKGVGEFCDFSGAPAYRRAPTESVETPAFFAKNFGGAHGLVWVRLGTHSRSGRTCDLDTFVKVALPTITKPFVLITTDGDTSVPSEIPPATVAALKASPFLVRWYSQNFDGTDADVRPFPIGLDLHTPRKRMTPARLVRTLERVGRDALPVAQRPLRIFCDLAVAMSKERLVAIRALWGCDHIDFVPRRVSQAAIWQKYAQYPFVLSAHGNALDCHRTWELLHLGCIVVTRSSSLDPLYEGLPVAIVEDWREVRDPSLMARWMEQYAPLLADGRTLARLRAAAWIEPIRLDLEVSARAAP